MKIFSYIFFVVLIIWATYIGFDGDTFTRYFAKSLYVVGAIGLIITALAKQICARLFHKN